MKQRKTIEIETAAARVGATVITFTDAQLVMFASDPKRSVWDALYRFLSDKFGITYHHAHNEVFAGVELMKRLSYAERQRLRGWFKLHKKPIRKKALDEALARSDINGGPQGMVGDYVRLLGDGLFFKSPTR